MKIIISSPIGPMCRQETSHSLTDILVTALSVQPGTTSVGVGAGFGGNVTSRRWHVGHLRHAATSVGGRRQRHSAPVVVVRHYKLHSRCSGQHVLVAGRQPTARAPLHSHYGTDNQDDIMMMIIIIVIIITRRSQHSQECKNPR